MVMEQRHLLHAIPDPHDYPLDEYQAEHWPTLRQIESQPPNKSVVPLERVHFVKRTKAYATLEWQPETVHYTFEMEEVEAPYWKFTSEDMREAILEAVRSLAQPIPGTHPNKTVAFGVCRRKDFYVLCKTVLGPPHTITGWVEKSEVGTFDATH